MESILLIVYGKDNVVVSILVGSWERLPPKAKAIPDALKSC